MCLLRISVCYESEELILCVYYGYLFSVKANSWSAYFGSLKCYESKQLMPSAYYGSSLQYSMLRRRTVLAFFCIPLNSQSRQNRNVINMDMSWMLKVKLKILQGLFFWDQKQAVCSSTFSLYGIFIQSNTPHFTVAGSPRAINIKPQFLPSAYYGSSEIENSWYPTAYDWSSECLCRRTTDISQYRLRFGVSLL
jgi:hypothetical protein